jgi:hypothetical protein
MAAPSPGTLCMGIKAAKRGKVHGRNRRLGNVSSSVNTLPSTIFPF